jgi:uncharacterized protein (DUF3084 family)
MVSGYVLILAVLLLGGVIATLGDRIGMKVGKARLSLFNLRPKQTATVVSIATGSVISASTLALLFGVSSQLRTGVFELGKIQDDLAQAEADLANARQTQTEVEKDLESSVEERERATARLQEINQFLAQAVEQQDLTEAQLQQTQNQLQKVSDQAQTLRQTTDQLRSERDRLLAQQANISEQIAQRDAAISALDREIAERDRAISQREERLATLEQEQIFLEQQVAALEKQYQGLFLGNIALGRNEEIVTGILRADTPGQALQILRRFLAEANFRALQRIAPGTSINREILSLNERQLQQLLARISTGQEFVIRILSAANYVTGETCVIEGQDSCIDIFIDASPNQLVYSPGERLASIAMESPPFSDRDVVERFNYLVVTTQFRAQQDGVAVDEVVVADNSTETLVTFLQAIRTYGRPLDIQAIAARDVYTIGPVNIGLVAVDTNNRVLFWTNNLAPLWNNPESPTLEDPADTVQNRRNLR